MPPPLARMLVASSLVTALLHGCRREEEPELYSTAPSRQAAAPSAAPAATPQDSLDLDPRDTKGLLQAVESMKASMKDRPRDFGVNVALGNLYFDNGRYSEALEFYRDAVGQSAAAEQRIRALAKVKPAAKVPVECRAEPSPAEAARGEKNRTFETLAQVLEAQKPSDGSAAAACARVLAPMLANLHARRGNAWYLAGDADQAREAHEEALALDPAQPESLFFRGAHILENARGDATQLAQGRAVWEQLLKVAPNHPRAELVRQTLPKVAELFGAKTAPADNEPQGPGPLPPGLAAAMQRFGMGPAQGAELDKTLDAAEALLAKGSFQEALDTFKTVMPVRPDGRVALGMGIALRELGKPTAERVLLEATRMPNGDAARAHYELGLLYEKSDPARARAEFVLVPGSSPWAAKAKARLSTLK